jgi:hypothetical protein
MAKKYPSELNSRTVRINLGDYWLLAELSRKHNITFGEALHLLITEQAEREAIIVPRAQIPMPIQTVARSTPIDVSFSREVEGEVRYRHNDR